jgi:hypothetical protein
VLLPEPDDGAEAGLKPLELVEPLELAELDELAELVEPLELAERVELLAADAVAVLCVAPGSTTATAPAVTTPATPIAAVVTRTFDRARSLAASACLILSCSALIIRPRWATVSRIGRPACSSLRTSSMRSMSLGACATR